MLLPFAPRSCPVSPLWSGLQGQVLEQPQVVEAAPPVPQDLAGRMSYVKVVHGHMRHVPPCIFPDNLGRTPI